MWTSSDSKMPQSAGASTIQSPTASPADIPGAPAQVAYSAIKNQHSMIGKSIVIKGEITASDPVYIDGRVEGLINAPTQRVTIGREGKVKVSFAPELRVEAGGRACTLHEEPTSRQTDAFPLTPWEIATLAFARATAR